MFEKMAIFLNKTSGDRFVIYRDDFETYLEDYDLTAAEAELLPLEEVTADELANLAAGEFENANFHSFVDIPEKFLQELRNRGFDETQQLEALWAFIESSKDLLL